MKLVQRLPILILFIGIILRLKVYLENRSLFLDEANLALNLIELDPWALFMPLQYQQFAPPLYNLLTKGFWHLFGPTEWSLRLTSMVGGLLSLWILYLFMKALKLKPWTQATLLYFIAFSLLSLRYATELKPYATDMAVALALTLAAKNTTSFTLGKAFAWAAAGAFAIWFSFPSIFVLLAVGIYWLFSVSLQKEFFQLLTIGLSWIVSFAFLYTIQIQQSLEVDLLIDYHEPYFFPLFPSSTTDLLRIGALLLIPIRALFGYTVLAYIIGSVLCLLGVGYLIQKRQSWGLLLLIPILSCYLASGLGYYSLIPRLVVFLLPFPLLLFGLGLEAVVKLIQTPWAKVAVVGILLIPLVALPEGLSYFASRLEIAELKPLLLHLNEHPSKQAPLYVDHLANPAFRFYTAYHSLSSQLDLGPVTLADWDEDPLQWQIQSNIQGAAWFLYGHLMSQSEQDRMGTELEKLGGQLQLEQESKAARLWLVEP